MSTTQTTMGVKLEKATRARLARLGKARDRSPHWLVKQAIEAYLEKEEATEAMAREDLERWDEYLATGISYSLDEVSALFADLKAGKKVTWRK